MHKRNTGRWCHFFKPHFYKNRVTWIQASNQVNAIDCLDELIEGLLQVPKMPWSAFLPSTVWLSLNGESLSKWAELLIFFSTFFESSLLTRCWANIRQMADPVEIDQVRSNKGSYGFLNMQLVKLQVPPPHTLCFAIAKHTPLFIPYYLPIDNAPYPDGAK